MARPARARRATSPGRDRFLDAIRALALVRVVLWHTYGMPLLTYIVAAVPTMVFVTGSLLAGSLDRRPWRVVLADRTRRILLPMWVFGATAFAAMSVAAHADPGAHTRVPWRSIVFWIVPLGDPQGSAWEGGWMSQPLWYVRAMFWLLLLSPVARAAQRRVGDALFVIPVAGLVLLEVLGRRGVTIKAAPELLWQVGDLCLYGIFLLGGFAHHDGRFARLDARAWRRGALVAGAAAVLWIATQPVPLGIVNNSHPAHLLVGATWLCVLFSAREPIERLAARPAMRQVVDALAARSMTVYLWHSTAIIVTYQLLAPHGGLPVVVHDTAMLTGTAAVTAVLVLAAGWVEDVAARRAPRLWPRPTPPRSTRRRASHPVERARRAAQPRLPRVIRAYGVIGLFVLALGAATAGTGAPASPDEGGDEVAAASGRRPPVPSQGPPRPVFERRADDVAGAGGALVDALVAAASTGTPEVDAVTASVLQQVLDSWRTRWSVPGVTVSVALPRAGAWSGASGIEPFTGRPASPSDVFDIASITKTFTGALVLQLAAEGRIDLDAPVPPLALVPAFPYDAGITVRQLLEHRSGLVPYRETPQFLADPLTRTDPAAALDAAVRAPLQFPPGAASIYSSTNFLPLGFLLEQVSGQSYDELLQTRLLDPVGLDLVTHLPSRLDAPNFSTAGIVADVGSLVQWSLALYRDGRVLDTEGVAAMHRIDPVTGLGGASYGYCPCTVDSSGTSRWRWIGHSSGDTQMAYSRADDVAVVIHVADSLWVADRQAAVAELLDTLRVMILELSPPDTFVTFALADEDGAGADDG